MGIRITEIDVPFGGVSWEYTEDAKHDIQSLLYFLETKRLLVDSAQMEVKSWCAKSAIEIKARLYDTIAKQNFDEETVSCLREMMDACNDFLNRLEHLILPVLVLVLSHLALFLRIARNFINETFSQIFVQNLYARALREKDIYFLVLRYSLSPIIAYFGGSALSFMMGTYVVESVFAYEGLGSLLFESILFKDFPMALALIFFSDLLAAFFTFLSDVFAWILNPRLKRLKFV